MDLILNVAFVRLQKWPDYAHRCGINMLSYVAKHDSTSDSKGGPILEKIENPEFDVFLEFVGTPEHPEGHLRGAHFNFDSDLALVDRF